MLETGIAPQHIPDTGVTAPLTLLTADLAKLPVIVNAVKNEAKMLLAPTAISSCELSTSYWLRMASALATAMLSMYTTNGTIPSPAPNDVNESATAKVLFPFIATGRKGLCRR